MPTVQTIQSHLRALGLPGMLLADFRRQDPLCYRLLDLPASIYTTRRWFYLIPATGSPVRLVSRVEPAALDCLPGEKLLYAGWRELHSQLKALSQCVTGPVAVNHSPHSAIPTVSTLDAGLLELIQAAGFSTVSSAQLIALCLGSLSDHQIQTHKQAGVLVHQVLSEAFEEVARVRDITEWQLAQFINRRFDDLGLTNESHGPIVAANANAANPHFEPTSDITRPICPASSAGSQGDALLIDLWAKLKDDPQAVYFDITWCAFVSRSSPPAVPPAYQHLWSTAAAARDAALAHIRTTLAAGRPLTGADIDDACRNVIDQAGLGQHFVHRTGHAIDTRTHGSGVNIDNLETQDTRQLLPGACFSIEPGIYPPPSHSHAPFGVRTEINVLIDRSNQPQVFGPIQKDLVIIKAQ